MNALTTLLGEPPAGRQRPVEVLSWLAAGTLLVALILAALAQALSLPSNFGVEDWLGWRQADTLLATLKTWHQPGLSRLPAAAAYLLIDIALFMPLYGLALLWATRLVLGALSPEPLHGRLIRGLAAAATPALALLWAVDAVENLGGLARLGIATGWGVLALAVAAVAFLLLRRWAAADAPRAGMWALGWLLASLVIAGLASWGLTGVLPDEAWLRDAVDGLLGGGAHAAKPMAMALAFAPPLGLWLCWWFGLDLDSRPSPAPGAAARAEHRSACRQVALGVVGRSRYVLVVLGLFGAFTLLLDQCRDVLLALATPAVESPADWAWWFAVMAASVLGLTMLSHACWLWARLVGRVKRSGYEVPALDGVAAWAGEWARSWARLLMLVPLAMTALLIATVAGDAVIAVSSGATQHPLLATLVRLGLFTAALLGAAVWLMRQRQSRALLRAADYYNSVRAVRPLLHDPAYVEEPPPGAAPAAHEKEERGLGRHISLLARPVWQPLVALALLLAVRAAMLLAPDVTGTAPAALAVLALSLVWWLGPLGLIAMSEQRAVLPWALLLMLAVGALSLVSDNHSLPGLVIADAAAVPATLASLAQVTLAALLLLAAGSALIWLVLVLRSRDLLDRIGRRHGRDGDALHRAADGWRAGLSLALLAAICAGLFGLGRWAASVTPQRPDAPPRPLAQAVQSLPDAAPLLLIASEGGGVRAAYWTAQLLAAWQDADAGWAGRVVAMSGVSGGSMGLAVWRACARGDRGDADMKTCVQRRFRDLDALSPLLAGLLFEDVWMRLLPSDWLCRPAAVGCGMRSRALAFEREWMRAFPRLAEPLGAARPQEAQLLLNSTVAESGNRALLATLNFPPGTLPGAEDLLASGRVPPAPSLVTAAHTSARFPFVNPLASLPKPATSGLASAHLVDGGYHDNSGTASLADLLTHLQAAHVGRRIQLVLIRNGQVPTRCLAQALSPTSGEPPPACLRTSSDARELLPPRDAQRLGFYADLLGPALAAVNNLGTGAHGREPVAALAARLAAGAPLPPDLGCAPTAAVCLLDQMQDGGLVPLGWTLSPAARAAMDAQARVRIAQVMQAAK